MDHHLRILQQRIESVAVGGNRAGDQRKRMRRKVDQREEEDLHRADDHRGVRHQPRIHLVPQPQHQPVGGQQPAPEQQRALLSRPERGKLIGSRQGAVGVVQDVGDRKVVVERGINQHRGGRRHRQENRDSGAARRLAQTIIVANNGK